MKAAWAALPFAIGCGARAAPAPSSSAASPLAAVLGALACPEVTDRTFALASGGDDVVDTYVRVNRCQTNVDRDELAIVTDAYVWIAVDRDIGPVAVRSFVHGTLHLQVRAKVSARDDGRRLLVTLEPREPKEVAVETVGLLDLAPQDWAALVALEVAPSAGVSPERAAKAKIKKEAERALRNALAKPITVAYDARAGATMWADAPAPPKSNWRRHRVAAHGSAVVGPFPAMATTVRVRVSPNGLQEIAARAVCVAHAEHLLEADRRGDRVSVDDWARVRQEDGPQSISVPAMPCPWVLALRTLADGATLVDVEPPSVTAEDRPARTPERWVSLDDLVLDANPEDGLLSVIATTGTWSEELHASKLREPRILVLAPDEDVHLRLLRRDRDTQLIEADSQLDLTTPGPHESEVVLATKDGRTRVTVRMRARVLTTP